MTVVFAGELSALHDEFLGELKGIREFANPVSDDSAKALSARARVAAANGATLLLAALYEECVRQMVRASFNFRRVTAAGRLSFPEKLPSIIWRRSLELLARKQLDDLVRDGSQVDLQLKDIVSFCIKGDLAADVSNAVSHNENNMRPEEMGRLFNQIGIQGIVTKLGECPDVQTYFGLDNPEKTAESTRSALEDFFRRRNEIAHAIQIGASDGPVSLAKDVEFFEIVSGGLVYVLTRELEQIASSGRRRAGPRRPRRSERATAPNANR
jgi:hypothetical protein